MVTTTKRVFGQFQSHLEANNALDFLAVETRAMAHIDGGYEYQSAGASVRLYVERSERRRGWWQVVREEAKA